MNLKLVSWNVNGIRAVQKKGFWGNLKFLNPDILCVQEIKTDKEKMKEVKEIFNTQGYEIESFSAKKLGYSGVANIFKSQKTKDGLFNDNFTEEHFKKPITILNHNYGVNNDYFDIEGRLVTTFFELQHKKFALLNGYYPQGGRGEDRIKYKLEFYKEVLEEVKRVKDNGFYVILCGDFNTAFSEIDLARPKENKNTTGFLKIERDGLEEFFNAGFVDTFRFLNPETTGAYSYWDQITRARDRNVGWRIDYFLIDKDLLPFLKEAKIYPHIFGSDHAPVSIELEF